MLWYDLIEEPVLSIGPRKPPNYRIAVAQIFGILISLKKGFLIVSGRLLNETAYPKKNGSMLQELATKARMIQDGSEIPGNGEVVDPRNGGDAPVHRVQVLSCRLGSRTL